MIANRRWIQPMVLALGCLAGCQSQTSRRLPYTDNPLLQTRQPLTQTLTEAGNRRTAQLNEARETELAQAKTATNKPSGTAVGKAPGGMPPAPLTNPLAANPLSPSLPQPPSITQAPSFDPAQPMSSTPTLLPARNTQDSLPLKPVPEQTNPSAMPVIPAANIDMGSNAAIQANGANSQKPRTSAATPVYGHALDHSWLQGELDRHYRGHFELRFRAPSEDDPLGGKVRLENDPRLDEFRSGDIVYVEGELFRGQDDASSNPSQRSSASGKNGSGIDSSSVGSWSQNPRYRVRTIRRLAAPGG